MNHQLATIHQDTSSLVFLLNGTPKTTSLAVAETFEKQHKDVLKKIDSLDCSEDFTKRNFALSEYTDSTGRPLPMYEMTRDGFTILAMGFNGKKAMQFKEKYIAAFNAMEQTVKHSPSPAVVDSLRLGKELAAEFGLEGNQLLLSASHFVKKQHGVDLMDELGVTHLLSADQQTHLTPTELGELLGGLGPQQVNGLLEVNGYQTSWHSTKTKNGKERQVKHWTPTETGKPHSVLLDTKKAHTDGTPVQQLKWKQSVISLLRSKLKDANSPKAT